MPTHIPAHRVMTLKHAADAFGLDAIWQSSAWEHGDDTLTERYHEEDRVMAFDGDMCVEAIHPQHTAGQALRTLTGTDAIVIVRGNLQADFIHMAGVGMLFVFGNIMCDTIHFHASHVAWVQGDVTANVAILASSDQDDTPYPKAVGRNAVRIEGRAASPLVRSWWIRLSHVHWGEGSGTERYEEKELPQQQQLCDPIWK